MKDRLHQAALRRQQLVAQCGAQRAELAAQLQPLGHTLDSMNVGLRIVRRIRQHPEWLAAGAIGLMLLTPARLSAAVRTATQLLRTWCGLAPSLQMLLGRLR